MKFTIKYRGIGDAKMHSISYESNCRANAE